MFLRFNESDLTRKSPETKQKHSTAGAGAGVRVRVHGAENVKSNLKTAECAAHFPALAGPWRSEALFNLGSMVMDYIHLYIETLLIN